MFQPSPVTLNVWNELMEAQLARFLHDSSWWNPVFVQITKCLSLSKSPFHHLHLISTHKWLETIRKLPSFACNWHCFSEIWQQTNQRTSKPSLGQLNYFEFTNSVVFPQNPSHWIGIPPDPSISICSIRSIRSIRTLHARIDPLQPPWSRSRCAGDSSSESSTHVVNLTKTVDAVDTVDASWTPCCIVKSNVTILFFGCSWIFHYKLYKPSILGYPYFKETLKWSKSQGAFKDL